MGLREALYNHQAATTAYDFSMGKVYFSPLPLHSQTAYVSRLADLSSKLENSDEDSETLDKDEVESLILMTKMGHSILKDCLFAIESSDGNEYISKSEIDINKLTIPLQDELAGLAFQFLNDRIEEGNEQGD